MKGYRIISESFKHIPSEDVIAGESEWTYTFVLVPLDDSVIDDPEPIGITGKGSSYIVAKGRAEGLIVALAS